MLVSSWESRCFFCRHSSLEVAPMEALYSEIDSLLFGDIEWEIPRSNLKVEKEIGNGSFGVVSRGLAFNLPGKPEWTVVAVKSIKGHMTSRGVDSHMKQTGMLVGNFEFNPKGDQSGRGLSKF